MCTAVLGVAQVTYGLQPFAPEGLGWPTKSHHILTSSIMRCRNKTL